MVKFYQLAIIMGLTFFVTQLNTYQVNWVGIPKAGSISGQVLSVVGDRPIKNAVVTVLKNGEKQARVTTDAKGFFTVPGLAAEQYNVMAENQYYGSLTIESVPVIIGNDVTTHFILTPKYTIQ